MIRLVFYDIQVDAIRLKISKFLLRKGFERLQKSVFIGECSSNKWQEMQKPLEKLYGTFEIENKIQSIVLEENAVWDMYCLGEKPDFEYICGRKKIIFF